MITLSNLPSGARRPSRGSVLPLGAILWREVLSPWLLFPRTRRPVARARRSCCRLEQSGCRHLAHPNLSLPVGLSPAFSACPCRRKLISVAFDFTPPVGVARPPEKPLECSSSSYRLPIDSTHREVGMENRNYAIHFSFDQPYGATPEGGGCCYRTPKRGTPLRW